MTTHLFLSTVLLPMEHYGNLDGLSTTPLRETEQTLPWLICLFYLVLLILFSKKQLKYLSVNLRSVNINFRRNTSVFPGATKTSSIETLPRSSNPCRRVITPNLRRKNAKVSIFNRQIHLNTTTAM